MRFLALCMLILGCGDSARPPRPPPLSPYPTCPSCQHAQFVVNQMVIPQNNLQAAEEVGCDIDGDGRIDNQWGVVMHAFRMASTTIDPQAATNAAFQSGSLIMLDDVEYEPSLTTTQVAGLRAFIGAHDPSDGLGAPAFYMGQGRFTVSSENGVGMGGSIGNGSANFGPNDAIVEFFLVPNQAAVVLPLTRSHLSGTFDATMIQMGKLCGAIDAQDVPTMFPQFADMVSAAVKAGGSMPDLKGLFDSDHSCDTDPACVPSSAAQCHCISVSEIENNSVLRSLLSPDLDLDPNKTNPFVSDPVDPTYVNDAVSFGVGITANAATFPLP